MSIINKIRISGVTYDIGGSGGGSGSTTVELTQAQYDALVSAGTVSPTTYYIITDATPIDVSNYWTSAQTESAITQAVSGKASQSDLLTVSGQVANKQDTLVSGTNIKTINNESILGSGNIDIQGGGGSSYTAGDGIDITNNVISVTGKADTSAVTESINAAVSGKADTSDVTAIQDSLSGYVTTNTAQNINSEKTFVYDGKGIIFKQSKNSSKIGFSLRNTAATNNEVASFEFRPDTFTIDGVKHPLLYFGHYRTTNLANASVPQTVIGFRQYDQKNYAAYHYLMPLPEKAKTPFSLTTSFKDYYAPMGFKNGSTMITADNTGVVDLSSEFSGKADTSAVTESINAAVSGKASQSDLLTVSGQVANKQDTLVSGTNIKTINNESILGSGNIDIQGGGGASYTAGTGIDITNDVISVTGMVNTSAITSAVTSASTDSEIPTAKAVYDAVGQTTYSAGRGISINGNNAINLDVPVYKASNSSSAYIGTSRNYPNNVTGEYSFAVGLNNLVSGRCSMVVGGFDGYGDGNSATTMNAYAFGRNNLAKSFCSFLNGYGNISSNYYEYASGRFNNSVSASTTWGNSGNTLFSVGNGTSSSARHNAFEIRQNGDIYLSLNGQDVKLQDQLGQGGGGSSYTAGDGIDITNNVISVTGKVDTSAITTSVTSSSTDSQVPSAKAVYDQFGGLKLVKLTQQEYDALTTKDSNTLYVIV